MTLKICRASGRFRLFAALAALAAGAALGGCRWAHDDRFVLLRRAPERAAGAPTPLLLASADDLGAARVRRLMSDRFAGELLLTLAMVRRLVGATAPRGSVARARAEAPAYVALGVSDLYRERPYRERVIGTGWSREVLAADVPIVWIDDGDPARTEVGRTLGLAGDVPGGEGLRDAVALEQLVSGFGRAILDLVAPPETDGADGDDATDPLAAGYVRYLDVVNAEWRSAGGPAALADARGFLRTAGWFAGVRGNQGVALFAPDGGRGSLDRRIAPEGPAAGEAALKLVRDPTVIATVLYRLAASAAGHRLAPDETYRWLVPEQPPAGVSPGRLLGAFRNFQGKLLSAWNRAVRAGRSPHDLVDLVEAYAAAYPDERPEVTRIFLVTTYGITAVSGGIDPQLPPEGLEARLAALTADVLFGRSDLRSAPEFIHKEEQRNREP